MNKKAPLPCIRSQKPTWCKVAALARKWELQKHADRLEELGWRDTALPEGIALH
jgi:hypothetical protein